MIKPVRKTPITACAPRPGDHLAVKCTKDTWRHGIYVDDAMVVECPGQSVTFADFGDSEYMVYVVEYRDLEARRDTALVRVAWAAQHPAEIPCVNCANFCDQDRMTRNAGAGLG